MSWSQNLLECTTVIRLLLYVIFVFLNVHCVMILGKMHVYKFVSLKLYSVHVLLVIKLFKFYF